MNNLLILGAGVWGMMIQETALQIGYDGVAFLDDAKKEKISLENAATMRIFCSLMILR